jgi:NADH-quinone oxidoreductase subunit A
MASFVLPVLATAAYNQWAALGILFVIAAVFAAANVVLSESLGPKRKGRTKGTPYESGMDPVGDTKQRFNVRFYLVAMIFLVFDVEVLFLIPWVTIFNKYKELGFNGSDALLFGSMLTFVLILLVSYVYAWGKGVFKWD